MTISSSIKRFFMPILWMIMIYYLSSQPDLPSNKIDYLDFIMKKTAHFTEYLVLTVLWFRALQLKSPSTALLISLAYAFTDEIHQLFVPGRTGNLRDVFIDGLGVFLGILIINRLKLWKYFSFPRQTRKLGK